MRFAWTGVFLMVIGFAGALSEAHAATPDDCLRVRTAVLRLGAIAGTIDACTSVINNKTEPRRVHADAYAQRGMLYARRWRLIDAESDALRAIADISEGLSFKLFGNDRLHQLLLWRAQLYEATRQTSKASDDYRSVLRINPSDMTAKAALQRLDAPTN